MNTTTHSPACTGCPHCNSVFAALAAAPPREQAQFNGLRSAHLVATQSAPAVLAAPAPRLPPLPRRCLTLPHWERRSGRSAD